MLSFQAGMSSLCHLHVSLLLLCRDEGQSPQHGPDPNGFGRRLWQGWVAVRGMEVEEEENAETARA